MMENQTTSDENKDGISWLKEFMRDEAEKEIIINFAKTGNFHKAEQLILEKLKTKSDDEEGYLVSLAIIYISNQRVGSGIKVLGNLLRKYPNNPFAHHLLGNLYLSINLDKAKKYYETALKLSPNEKRFQESYLELLIIMQDKEEINKFKEIIKTNLSPTMVASLASLEEDLIEREEILKKELKNNPNNIDLILELAKIYFFKLKYKDAKNIIEKELKKKPNSLILNIAFKHLTCCQKWWYMPKAIFSSLAERSRNFVGVIGIYIAILIGTSFFFSNIFYSKIAINIFVWVWLIFMVYLILINRIIGVKRWW